MNAHRKALRIIGGVFVAYALLVAPHEGEFWPFSIYPMFSQAGDPWTRALVREVPTDLPDSSRWKVTSLDDLPGKPFPLAPNGVFQNDLANYVSKTRDWDHSRLRGIRTMFSADTLQTRQLLVMRVQGALSSGDSVAVTATPFILLSSDSTWLNPELPTSL